MKNDGDVKAHWLILTIYYWTKLKLLSIKFTAFFICFIKKCQNQLIKLFKEFMYLNYGIKTHYLHFLNKALKTPVLLQNGIFEDINIFYNSVLSNIVLMPYYFLNKTSSMCFSFCTTLCSVINRWRYMSL